jgi:hypothetical protein
MKVYLPVYTTAVGPVLHDLYESLAEHQTQLFKALVAGSYEKQQKNPVDKSIADHVALIVDIMDLRTGDYREHMDYVQEWFGASVFYLKREYVLIKSKWYERTWKKSVIKAPLAKQGVVFLKDWTSKHPTAGLSILTDKKKLRTLTYGMAVEKQSKQIVSAGNAHMKKYRGQERDESNVKNLTEQFLKIEDQFIRDRGLKVNEAVKEIIKESRLLLFTGPVTHDDTNYYKKNGLTDVRKRLELVAFQTRNEANPVVMLDCDARMLRPVYDNADKGHNAVAEGLAQILDSYTKGGKTVN